MRARTALAIVTTLVVLAAIYILYAYSGHGQ
jgi:hypothetical protein